MRKFGLEVEYGGDIQSAVNHLRAAGLTQSMGQASYLGHSSTDWVVKSDASVSRGGELVSPPLLFDDPEQRGQVNRAIEALRASGAHTEPSAGIHVHVDASDLTAEQVALVARCFTKFEDILYRLASSGWRNMRPGSTTYCKPLSDTQVLVMTKVKNEMQLGRAYYGRRDYQYSASNHGDSARYRGLNIHSWFGPRKTIEFRIFNSSLNADRIQAYIAICVAIVEDARRGNRRSVTKAFRLGGMRDGSTDPRAAYHRFQQVIRYQAGMSLEDYKLMNKCWKDSVPQAAMTTGGW